jgi:uncharacterized protein with von Willebrand factor type A (vWA) domain
MYNKDEIYQESLIIAQDENIYFVQDIIDSLCIGKTTFYTFFPDESNELNTLKENLFKNRITEKKKLRKKLSQGNGSEIIALYKLIGNDEERKALSTNWNENNNSGNITINWTE